MSFPWHFGNISRLRAEELLLNAKKNGSFLIRDSESIPNAHVLCLLHEGSIYHFRILPDPNNGSLYLQAVPGMTTQGFKKLEHLVTFYSQASKGLPCELKQPAASEENDIIDDDTDDEDDDLDETDSKQDEDDYVIPAQSFRDTVDQLKPERMDGEFCTALGIYLGQGLKKDIDTASSGGTVLEGLQALLATTSTNLIQELQCFLQRVNMLQEVFSIEDERKLKCTLPDHSAEEKPSFKLLMDLLAESIAGAKLLQNQAAGRFTDVAKINQQCEDNDEPEGYNRKFEVMTQGLATSSFKNKMFILVNCVEGKMSFLKSPNEAADAGNTYDQAKVLQLIKSRRNIKRLGLALESKPLREFEFDDGKTREVFCQLVQQMKNQFSRSKIKNPVSIFVGTWNMGNANPPADLRAWFKCQGLGKTRDSTMAKFPYDIYAFGTQECPVSEKDWIARIKQQLAKLFPLVAFHMVSVCTLWSIRLVVFLNETLKHMVSHVKQSSVKTGIANALGNKGGVGISFSLGSVPLCFINCHLAARSERVQRRNQNFRDILNGLNLGQKSVFGLTEQFHHVFWFGDLNYRIDMEVKDVLEAVKCNSFAKLKHQDQLMKEKNKGNVLVRFKEDPISFPPTYRYKRGNKTYIWEKVKRCGTLVNVPSWCDRVWWHSYPETRISCTSYGCTEDLRTSDHWPVFCTFDVTLPLAGLPGDGISKCGAIGKCMIIFQCIRAKIKTNSTTHFYIEFHSSCLKGMEKTDPNNILDSSARQRFTEGKSECGPVNGSVHSYPEWSQHVIPKLYPVMLNRQYLEEQHLLLAVKSVDNDESYGECCVPLRTVISAVPQKPKPFVLSHLGEKTGEIMVEIHVKHPGNDYMDTSPQSFDLIRVADLEENSVDLLDQAVGHMLDPSVAPPKRHSAPQVAAQETRSPPPLPAKKSKPKTVEEMMQKIGFPQYTPRLLEYGWDNLDFLNEMTETDLDEARIPRDHRRMILAAIKSLAS